MEGVPYGGNLQQSIIESSTNAMLNKIWLLLFLLFYHRTWETLKIIKSSYDRTSKLNELTLKVMHSDFIVSQMEILDPIEDEEVTQYQNLVPTKKGDWLC